MVMDFSAAHLAFHSPRRRAGTAIFSTAQFCAMLR
jgi:hypothetical protein